jgi:hypothetical protein
MKNLVCIVLFLSFTSFSLACEVYQPDQFNFSTSVGDRNFFAYKNNGDESFAPFFRVSNCASLANSNKFLMISFGPQNQEFSDRIKAYDVANQTRDSGCKILNSPFKTENDYPTRRQYLNEKWNTIKSCYRIIVKDEGGKPIQFPEKQPGCKYQVNSQNEIEFNGGYCFLSPTDSSSYHISFKVKDECLDYEGLRKLNIKVSDFQSVLNFYSAGDASGSSLDLIALKSFPLRFNISPNEDIFPASDVFGLSTPQFPANFYLPDTHLGTPEVSRSIRDKVILRLPLWADNTCSERCSNGFCQSLCDYSQPLTGEVSLYELDKEGKILPSGLTWFQGGVILPRYQGEISGTVYEFSEKNFKMGKIYRLIMTFNDPKFDFQSFKEEYKNKLLRTAQGLPSLGSSTIPTIPQLGVVGVTPQIPEIVQIGNLNFSTRIASSFESLMDSFGDFFKFKYWPPYFRDICHHECSAIKDKYLVLSVDLRIKSIQEDSGQYDLEVLSLTRTSRLLGDYVKRNPAMPKIKCERITPAN